MYQDLPMSERLDRIGELLAKGIYLHMKKEKDAAKVTEERLLNKAKADELNTVVDDKNK